jgi:2,4-dienoyl-CoA reductase-like NADH-dependent reductase (Old Yellow Enzyme family)
VLVKLNCSDFAEGEATFAECEAASRRLDALGIDGIEISGGDRVWATHNKTPSLYADYAAKIADEVRAPVILVGNNRDPLAWSGCSTRQRFPFSLWRGLSCGSPILPRAGSAAI